MVAANKRVLIISRDEQRYPRWLQFLKSAGWMVSRVDTRDEALANIPEFLPTLMFIDIGADEHVIDIDEDFAQRCRDSGLAAIPILVRPEPEDVANCYRRGAIDVLIEPFDDADMANSIGRAGSFKDLYQENMDYRSQLELANRSLRDSLNTLKMDQLAGREVQLNILPDGPLVYGDYEVAHKIVPSLYLSGDFVGYSVLLDRFLIFYMADVSGHGVSSAFVTIMLSFMVRQISRRHTHEDDTAALLRAPDGLLEHINRQVLTMKVDKHLTMLVGSIDTHRDVLRYVTAAQQPMPVMVTGSGAEYLKGKGKPIGLFDDAHWKIEEMAVPKSFSLSIASDGLLECLPGETMVERERSLLELVSHAQFSHENICSALKIDEVKNAPDDVSLLTITRRAS